LYSSSGYGTVTYFIELRTEGKSRSARMWSRRTPSSVQLYMVAICNVLCSNI